MGTRSQGVDHGPRVVRGRSRLRIPCEIVRRRRELIVAVRCRDKSKLPGRCRSLGGELDPYHTLALPVPERDVSQSGSEPVACRVVDEKRRRVLVRRERVRRGGRRNEIDHGEGFRVARRHVHVPRTVPEGVGRVRYATLGDIVFRGVRSDVDPVGHEDP